MTMQELQVTRPAPRRVAGVGKGRMARLQPYLFIAPAMAVYLAFLVWPMLVSLWTSLLKWDGLSADYSFVGLDNYRAFLFEDETARTALVNNVLWTLGALTIPTAFGLAMALVLNRRLPGTLVFRTILYAPAVLPLVATGLIWGWMYNPNFGAINVFLNWIGLGSWAGGWLSSYDMAMPSVFITYVWGSVGFPMILYLAGLQSINSEYYDAARVDGANAVQRFRHVTLPGLRESHVIVLSLAVIGGFKVFDLIYTMTYGGPGRVTQVLGTWMYFQTFQYYNTGYGAAIAWVIASIILVLAIPYIRHMSRE
jgi:raffinose/stachyose/melibiose transport system permease protein